MTLDETMLDMDSPRSKARVLLVDMRPAALRRTTDALERAGFEVVRAATFEEAKHTLANDAPDVLISALRLGAFNGLHLVHLGRLAHPHLPAIVISGTPDAVLQDEAQHAGAVFMVEPVHASSLSAQIARLLEPETGPSGLGIGQTFYRI